MKNAILSFTGNIKDSFRHVQGNARAGLLTQPIWSVLGNLFTPYVTLYMLAVGCTNEQVGQINAIGMAFGVVVAIFAGWLTNRMGRRLANAVGDMLCWVLASLLWGLSQNVVWFIIAACAKSFMRLSGVAWNCVLSEGTPPEHRVNIFWWISIVQTVTAFVTPLMNLLIGPFGLVPAMRWVLIGSSVVLTIAVIIRYGMMRELPVGVEQQKAVRGESPLAALKGYLPILKLIFSSPLLLISILMRTLYYVQIQLKATFMPIAVVHGMGFADQIIGTLNFVTGAVMLLAQFLLLRRLRTLSTSKALVVSLSTLAISSLILVVAPANSMPLLILSTVLSAAGSVVSAMLVDTSMANAMPDNERAQLLSLVTVLTVAISAPAMWLGGVLSDLPDIGTRLPMAMIAVFVVICLALLWAAAKMKKRSPEQAVGTAM